MQALQTSMIWELWSKRQQLDSLVVSPHKILLWLHQYTAVTASSIEVTRTSRALSFNLQCLKWLAPSASDLVTSSSLVSGRSVHQTDQSIYLRGELELALVLLPLHRWPSQQGNQPFHAFSDFQHLHPRETQKAEAHHQSEHHLLHAKVTTKP